MIIVDDSRPTLASRPAVLPPGRTPVADLVVHERSPYQPSRRQGPVALIAATTLVAATMALIATVRPGAVTPHSRPPLLVTMKLMPPPPPPPPPPAADASPPPEVTRPVPVVQLPTPPSSVPAVVDPPVQPVPEPPLASPVEAKAAAAAAAAPAAPGPSVEDGDLSARILAADPPGYPLESRRRHEQGTVKLLVIVGLDGRVASVSVAASSGSDRLDHAALAAVRHWRWSPTSRGGAAVMVRGTVTIPFVLKT